MENEEIIIEILERDGAKYQFKAKIITSGEDIKFDPFVGCIWPSIFLNTNFLNGKKIMTSGTFHSSLCRDSGQRIFLPSETYTNS